jgi:predicted nucleic acid-binding protein
VDVVVDTNVLAYALFGDPRRGLQALRVLGKADAIIVPDLLRPEIANALWQTARHGHVDRATSLAILDDTEALLTEVVPTHHLWADAVALSLAHEHPVYDTLFVALAMQRRIALVTYDRRLRQRFSEVALSPERFLEA